MTPSRRMPPRAESQDATFFELAILFVLVALLAGLFGLVVLQFLAVSWVFVPVFSLLVLWVFAGDRLGKRRLKSFSQQRQNDDICTFARSFERRAVDTWVIRAVYEELVDLVSLPDAPYRPRVSDRLEKDLLIDPDSLDFEIVPDICARIGRSLDGDAGKTFEGPVETVGDLVNFLNSLPRV